MKNTVTRFLFLLSISVLVFASCKHDKKSLFTGTWQMSNVKIQSDEQQKAMSQKQIEMLEDSISKNTDSVRLDKFQQQLMALRKVVTDYTAKQDSSMQNTRWEFKSDGGFIADEPDGKKIGTWSLDEDKMILSTIIDKQTASVPVQIDGDTLTLQFDSLNYMQFSRVK